MAVPKSVRLPPDIATAVEHDRAAVGASSAHAHLVGLVRDGLRLRALLSESERGQLDAVAQDVERQLVRQRLGLSDDHDDPDQE